MSIEKSIGAGLALGVGFMLVVGGWAQEEKGKHLHPSGTPPHEHPKAPVRITMEELHKHGGVPPGWRFALPDGDPKAGREAFVKLECYKCHEVKSEHFPRAPKGPDTAGPELTGMGGMHPVEYLAESILNPNAVIVMGPGYTGPDGLSIMPDYSEALTVRDLIDLVAYLKSLKDERRHISPDMPMPHGGGHEPDAHGQPGGPKGH